ncbi:MAG TPA: DUF3347 domain-containing protein [Ignavibacteria bacterium]|nr:DUF3347 domain-containing protein [Ignavibacteria bacterium]
MYKLIILIPAALMFISCTKKNVEDVNKKIDTSSKILGRDVDTVVQKLDTAIKKIAGADSVFNKVEILDVDESKLSSTKTRKKLNSVLEQYLDIKEDLQDNDSISVNKQARELRESLLDVQAEAGAESKQNKWNLWVSSVEKLAASLETAKTLREQRSLFNDLSSDLETMLMNFGVYSETVFKLKCARLNTIWLTKSKDLRNPYYGTDNANKEPCAEVVNAWRFD